LRTREGVRMQAWKGMRELKVEGVGKGEDGGRIKGMGIRAGERKRMRAEGRDEG
jgi:hypothetical protein